MRVIDLTHTIKENMPVYPGTEAPTLTAASTHESDGFRETLIRMVSHTGTHVDAPAHIVDGRPTLDEIPVSNFCGRALVIDCRGVVGGEITMAELRPYGDKIYEVDFLLFCLGWDKLWGTDAYFEGYPCIDDEVTGLIIDGSYKGIGFDAISLDPVASLKRHRAIFEKKDIINIENLTNLELCIGGPFDFVCLPLKYENADGAPVRAIAMLD